MRIYLILNKGYKGIRIITNLKKNDMFGLGNK